MTRVRHLRTHGGAVLAAALVALPLAACGGEEGPVDAPDGGPAASGRPTPSESATPTPTPTPSATETARPLSRFEDEATVRAMRRWAAALAEDLTVDDRSFGRSGRFLTPAGQENFVRYYDEEFGLEYPGPLPFTPVRVNTTGDRADVVACIWTAGWGVDPRTGQTVEAREITGVRTFLIRQARAWKLDSGQTAPINCDDVRVRGVS